MEATVTEAFWKLVTEKGGIEPQTSAQRFTKTFSPKEQTWERFKTVQGMTGTLQSDYTLHPEPAETDLDKMDEPYIAPSYHKGVLRDSGLDLSWSGEASALKAKIERGKKSHFEKGGEAKAYGRNHIRKQFKSLDLSRETLRNLNVPVSLSAIDESFAAEVPNLEELSISGHGLKKIENLPPKVISLNAHCNRITEWPKLPNCDLRHLGLSGNQIDSLAGLSEAEASATTLLTSLDLSSNRLRVLGDLKPLQQLPALENLKLAGNPMVLLPNYRKRVIAMLTQLTSLDGSAIVDNERPPPKEPTPEASEEQEAEPEPEPEAAEGEEGEEAQEPPPEPIDPDLDATIKLHFKLGVIEGLKNPNPPPPEPAEGEEEQEPPPEYLFYQENPPEYFIEIPVPHLPPLRTEKIQWSQTPPAEDAGDDAPVMNFELQQTLTLEASQSSMAWLRWEGVTLQLYMIKKDLPPPPPPEPDPDAEPAEEEAAAPAEGEGAEAEEPQEPPETFTTTRLATGVVKTRNLAEAGVPISYKAELFKYSEAEDDVKPIDDKMVEKALRYASKEAAKASRAGKKPSEVKPSKLVESEPKKKLMSLMEFSLELNPEAEPVEEE